MSAIMTAVGTASPTALDSLYASWLRSMPARNLARPACRPTPAAPGSSSDWLAANAPEVTAPEQVRQSDCETLRVELVGPGGACTAKTRHTGMSRFFALLVEEEEELTRSPMDKVRPPAVPDVPVPVLSDDELRRLFATCAGKTYADRRDTAIMRLFYDTGMRRSELAYLKVSDVDLDEQVAVGSPGRRFAPAKLMRLPLNIAPAKI